MTFIVQQPTKQLSSWTAYLGMGRWTHDTDNTYHLSKVEAMCRHTKRQVEVTTPEGPKCEQCRDEQLIRMSVGWVMNHPGYELRDGFIKKVGR